MKKTAIDRQRSVVAYHQSPKVPQPGDRAFDDPPPLITPQRPAILRRGLTPVYPVRRDQLDAAPGQLLAQSVAVVAFVSNHALGLLPRSSGPMPPSYPDRGERFLCQPDLRRRGRVKVVSQRNTLAVGHQHPLRALTPLGFSDSAAPFFAGAKLPSRNDSLQSSCPRSFNSLRNARQMSNQTPCSSQSRSRRQQVAGDGNSSGKSCQRAPLRSIHKMPSSTRRSSARGRPPRGCLGTFGSKGRICSHWASVNSRPYRAIGPPFGAAYGPYAPIQESELPSTHNLVPSFETACRQANAETHCAKHSAAVAPTSNRGGPAAPSRKAEHRSHEEHRGHRA